MLQVTAPSILRSLLDCAIKPSNQLQQVITSVTAASRGMFSWESPASSAVSGGCSTSGRSHFATASNAPLADPWTPTSQLVKRKTYQKRSRHLIQVLEQEQVQRLSLGRELPQFRAGDVLEVTTVVPEADRKVYTYKGVCIGRANKGPRSWFKIYNVFPDVGGFVQHFPLFMPDILAVKVVGRLPKAKRSKLYHLLQDESPRHVYQSSIAPPK